MESTPSTSRQGPTIRLHFLTHMATLHGDGEEEKEMKRLLQAHGAPQPPQQACPTAMGG